MSLGTRKSVLGISPTFQSLANPLGIWTEFDGNWKFEWNSEKLNKTYYYFVEKIQNNAEGETENKE